MAPTLIGMERSDLADLLQSLSSAPLPPFRATQIYEAIYNQRIDSVAKILTLPRDLRVALDAAVPFGLPTVAQSFQSTDGTQRYLLQLPDGKSVESVLMPEGDRYTFCISS